MTDELDQHESLGEGLFKVGLSVVLVSYTFSNYLK